MEPVVLTVPRGNRWRVDSDYEHSTEFEPLPDFDAEREHLDLLCFEMDPGDVIVFHALTVHGARPNCAQRRRRGYAVRYTGDDVTYFEGPGTNPRLINASLKPGRSIASGDVKPLPFQ